MSNSEQSSSNTLILSNHQRLELPAKSHLSGQANWDQFAWIFKTMLQKHKLWNQAENLPGADCDPYDILKNIHPDLWDGIRTGKDDPTAADIWLYFKSEWSNQTTNAKVSALKGCTDQTYSTNMEESLSIAAQKKRALVSAFGPSITTTDLADLLFVSRLPKDYEVVRAIEQSKDQFDFEKLVASLKTTWADIKTRKNAFTAKVEAKNVAFNCKIHNWDGAKPCYGCQKRALECKGCKANGKKYSRHIEFGPECPLIKSFMVNGLSPNSTAVVDSGSSMHIFNNKDMFDLYSPTCSVVHVADGNGVPTLGVGSIPIATNQSKPGMLTNVLHCPQLAANLLSIGQFCEKGFVSIFIRNSYYLFAAETLNNFIADHHHESILQGTKDASGLYVVNLETPSVPSTAAVSFLVSVPKRTTQDWHKALNHLSSKRLSLMKNGLVTGMQSIDDHKVCDCEACFMGKSKLQPYPSSTRVLHAVGDLISSDTWGPTTPDLDGNRYYISFIDHFSSKSWLFLYSSPAKVRLPWIS